MIPSLFFYRVATRALSPLVDPLLKSRARKGKEDFLRLNERMARNLPSRRSGALVWLHGASVGESQILLELGRRLSAERPDLMLLFTSQTQTSARLVGPALPDNAIHQMAPIDTPAIARRFIKHWSPDLVVFGEGEIWPNVIHEATKSGSPLALVNARMTQKTADGWFRWRGLFRHLFGAFSVVLAADEETARRLSRLLDRKVDSAGNMKSALAVPVANEFDVRRLRDSFLAGRRCLVAASTHDSEEALFLDAAASQPDAALIIAPRHPERGDFLEALLKKLRIPYARRSQGHVPTPRTRVLLADTMGEMGLWFRLADAVYVGGGHAEGVGGHNPLEPLRLGKPVVTGPLVHNFESMIADLFERGLVTIAADTAETGAALASLTPPPQIEMDSLAAEADAPMIRTLECLLPLLPPAGLLS